MSNTRQIQPETIFTSNGNKTATILSLINFFDYHFDDGSGKVNYKLIAMESPGSSIDSNGDTVILPESAVDLFNGMIEIPSSIVQQWGASDDVIWNYIASQLNLELI